MSESHASPSRLPLALASKLIVVVTLVGAGGTAQAQSDSMFGMPLYSPNLPKGLATVRVIGAGFRQPIVGAKVALFSVGAKAPPTKAGETTTGKDARAKLTGLKPRVIYFVEATANGKTVRSRAFRGPISGGVRLLLSTRVKTTPKRPTDIASVTVAKGSVGGLANAGTSAGSKKPVTNPHGASVRGRSGAAKLTKLADAADGTLRIKVALGGTKKPVRAMVRLLMGAKSMRRTTDDKGQLELVMPADAKSARISVGYGGLSYNSQPVKRPAKGGVQLQFTVYTRVRKAAGLRFGAGSHILCGVGEGRLGFRQVLSIENPTNNLFDPGPKGLDLPVPAGALRIDVMGKDKRFVKKVGKRVVLKTPIPPGRLTVQYFFELPYEGGKADFSQTMTLPIQRMVFAFTNNTLATLSGPVVLTRRTRKMGTNKMVLYNIGKVGAGSKLDVTIGGLPQSDKRTLLGAIGVAVLIIIWGIFAAARKRPAKHAKRDSLLDELAWLEAQKRRAEQRGLLVDKPEDKPSSKHAVDLQTYEERRAKLMTELRAVWREEGDDTAAASKSRSAA